jgi:hypothetical protein
MDNVQTEKVLKEIVKGITETIATGNIDETQPVLYWTLSNGKKRFVFLGDLGIYSGDNIEQLAIAIVIAISAHTEGAKVACIGMSAEISVDATGRRSSIAVVFVDANTMEKVSHLIPIVRNDNNMLVLDESRTDDANNSRVEQITRIIKSVVSKVKSFEKGAFNETSD